MPFPTTIPRFTLYKRDVVTAYVALGIQYRHNPKWLKALARGWDNLAQRKWEWDGSRLRVQSTSNPQTFYTASTNGCECHAGKAGLLCDHVTSWHLCHEAARVQQRAARRTKTIDLDAAVAELF